MPFLYLICLKDFSSVHMFSLRKETTKGMVCSGVKERQSPVKAAGTYSVACFLPTWSKAHLGFPR